MNRTPPALTIEPIGNGYYRVFLDDFEITHCTGIEFEMMKSSRIPIAEIKMLVVLDAINMERLSEAKAARAKQDETTD